jgi:hypothetical protein
MGGFIDSRAGIVHWLHSEEGCEWVERGKLPLILCFITAHILSSYVGRSLSRGVGLEMSRGRRDPACLPSDVFKRQVFDIVL